jgi:hypothetical protein
MPAGPHIFALLEQALSECFKYHNELDAFVRRVGLSEARLATARQRAEARKGRWDIAPKRFVAQEILAEIRTGSPDDDRLVSSIVTALGRTTFPNASQDGLKAVEALKKELDEDRRAAAERRDAQEKERENEQRKRDQQAAAKAAAREKFRQRFLALTELTDPQQRGYQLEAFLNDFMEFEGLSPRGSFRIIGEQIDGSFSWSSRTYLVEAKWVRDPVDGSGFGAFDWKISGKTADTRGLFLSINGYSPTAITALNGKGALRFVCIDGVHLMRATEFGWDLSTLLRIVSRHADETGEAYLPVSSPHFIARDR